MKQNSDSHHNSFSSYFSCSYLSKGREVVWICEKQLWMFKKGAVNSHSEKYLCWQLRNSNSNTKTHPFKKKTSTLSWYSRHLTSYVNDGFASLFTLYKTNKRRLLMLLSHSDTSNLSAATTWKSSKSNKYGTFSSPRYALSWVLQDPLSTSLQV